MANIFIIMGDFNSGKSTTIRSLTGLGRSKKICRIRLENNRDINIYVLINALQEDDDIKKVDQLIDISNGCENILVALRIGGRDPIRGSGYYHIKQLIERECVISKVVVLATENRQNGIAKKLKGIQGVPNPQFFVPLDLPANEIASQIRRNWGWR